MKPSITIILGSILLVLSLVGGGLGTISAFEPLTKDPSEEAVQTITTPSNLINENGDYEIWIKNQGPDLREEWVGLEIWIYDEGGDMIPVEKTDGDIDLQGGEYLRYGNGQFHQMPPLFGQGYLWFCYLGDSEGGG